MSLLNRRSEELTTRAWLETHQYCRGNGEPYPGANLKECRNPGRLIMSLSEEERNEIKQLKESHFNHEMMFRKKKKKGRWGLIKETKNGTNRH
jgi:hypothetical protein